MSRRIENIDFDSFPVDTYVLAQNCYPSFALQIVRVENFTAVVLSVTEEFTSEHHLVNQSRFAVVNVRNNCDVTNILH